MRVPRRAIRKIDSSWRRVFPLRVKLPKYVILLASSLHLIWAILLSVDPDARNATPLYLLAIVFGGPVRTSVVLSATALLALAFTFLKHDVRSTVVGGMLIPQQAVLLMSAGAGIAAAVQGHYADGAIRSSAFILVDQMPVILLAFLYTMCIFEAAFFSSKRLEGES